MAKPEEILKNWIENNSKQPVKESNVEKVIKEFLEDCVMQGAPTGSHYLCKLKHDLFISIKGSTSDGIISVIAHKKKVYYRPYIENITPFVRYIQES